MERIMTSLFIALLLCGCGFIARDAVAASHISHIAVEKDVMWSIEEGDLFKSSESGGSEGKVKVYSFEKNVGVLRIAALNGEVYAALRKNNTLAIERICGDGVSEGLFSVPYEQDIWDMVILQDQIAILWGHTDEEYRHGTQIDDDVEYDLSVYSFTGETTSCAYARAVSIAGLDDVTLLLIVSDGKNGFNAVSYNGHDKSQSTLGYVRSGGRYIFSGQPDILYVISAQGLQKVNMKTEEYLFLNPQVWMSNVNAYLCIGSETLQMLSLNDNLYQSYVLDDLQEGMVRNLKLINMQENSLSFPLLLKTIEVFKKRHPDVAVQLVEIEQMQLLVKLQAVDSDVDILYIEPGSERYLVDAGVLYDIRKSEDVLLSLNDWIGIDRMTERNGMLYGIPFDVFARTVSMNDDLWAKVGIEKTSDQYSWEELFDLGISKHSDIKYNGSGSIVFLHEMSRKLPTFFMQYLAAGDAPEQIDFETDEFGRLIEKYKGLCDLGLVEDWFTNYDMVDRALIVGGVINMSNLPNAVRPCTLPTIDNSARIPLQVGAIGISAFSENKALAEEFLALYTSKEIQASGIVYGLLKDIDAYEFPSQTEEDREVAREYLAYIAQGERGLFSQTFMEYASGSFETYLAERISTREMQRQLQGKLNMMLFE